MIGLPVYGTVVAFTALVRSDRFHLLFSISAALFYWAYLVDRVKICSVQKVPGALLAYLGVGSLLLLPAYLLAKKNISEHRFSWVHSGILRAGASKLPPGQANGYKILEDWFNTHSAPHEFALYYPYNAAFYFLVDRPAYRHVLLINSYIAGDVETMARALRQLNIRWVVWDILNQTFEGIPTDLALHPIVDYVHEAYEPAGKQGPFIFLRSKSAPSPQRQASISQRNN